jgi:F-type H+-transporting ATPase subunit c
MKRFMLILALILVLLPVGSAFAADAAQGGAQPEESAAAAKANFYATVAMACMFGMAIAAFGAAIGQSLTAQKALDGVARQPEASGKLQVQMILALVFIETLAIYTLVVALILLFANPFSGMVGKV